MNFTLLSVKLRLALLCFAGISSYAMGVDDPQTNAPNPAAKKPEAKHSLLTNRASTASSGRIRPTGTIDRHSSIEDLIAALESDEINQWSRATTFLGLRGKDAKAAVPALVKAIERPAVRYSALCALREIGPSAHEAIPALVKTLPVFPECWEASQALANIGPAAVPALQQAAESDDPRQKIWATAALVKGEGTNSPRLRILASMLQGREQIASEALRSIEMLGPLAATIVPDLKEAMKVSTVPQRNFVHALGRIGKAAESAMPEVLEVLAKRDVRGRLDAVRAVKWINGPSAKSAVPLLINELQGTNSPDAFSTTLQRVVREEAAETLGVIGADARPAIPALVSALKDPEERVRANAVTALVRIEPANPQALPGLIEAMRDPSSRVRYVANAALLKVGPVNLEVIRGFIRLVRDNAERFRNFAEDGLAGSFDGDGPSDGVVSTSESFFSRLGPDQRYAAADLRELARDSHPGVRRLALNALKRIGEVPE